MEALRRDAALIRGIRAYRDFPWRPERPERPVPWREGTTRLLDFGGAGVPLLVVPSLVNRADVLDLMPGHSMLAWLAARGARPMLLDWGTPGAAERRFSLADYLERLDRALAAAEAAAGSVVLAGYCMGGTLAVAAAARAADRLRGLALLAAPWDFHADDPARARALGVWGAMAGLAPVLPVDVLQTLFAAVDPTVAEKYRGFADLDPTSERARRFVALEDWLNDGVPLAGPVARECLVGWYGENAPARGAWRIGGAPMAPEAIRMPCFVAVPGRDRLVPPASARPLAARIAGAVLHEPEAGHIGMVAGARAATLLWEPLLAWLRALPAPGAGLP